MTGPHATDRYRGDGDPDAPLPRPGLSLPTDLARFHGVIAEVNGYLRSEGWTDVRYAHYTQSRQAVIVLVTVRQGERLERYVLKIFTRDVDLGMREYVNLGLFSRRLRELTAPVHTPMPILGGDGYYLMSYVDARTLDEWLAYGPRACWGRMADLIVLGLQAYHTAVSEVYGECHPRHVLVQDDASLCFIDCTISHHLFDAASMRTYSLLARDIGYWLHATMSLSLRGIVDPNTRSLTLLRFAKVLIDQAALRSPGTRREFVEEVLAVFGELRQRSAYGRRLRNSTLILLSWFILGAPCRRACS